MANRILRSTIGSLARAGEDLIEIVPLEDVTLVEAFVRPQDIVYAGQPVKVTITVFDYARYGSLDGATTRIGANAVTRSNRNEEGFFVVQVCTEGNILGGNGVPEQITPGMVTKVDIIKRWARYNLKVLDRLYVINHLSQDNTQEILENLRAEGLPIDIYQITEPEYAQAEYLRNLVRPLAA